MKKNVLLAILFVSTFGIGQSIDTTKKLNSAERSCSVRTYFPRDYQSNRCPWFDEVMVGITQLEPMVIRCARLQIMCTDNPTNSHVEHEEKDN